MNNTVKLEIEVPIEIVESIGKLKETYIKKYIETAGHLSEEKKLKKVYISKVSTLLAPYFDSNFISELMVERWSFDKGGY